MKQRVGATIFIVMLCVTSIIHASASQNIVAVEVAIGEMVDKITILQIKTERITDEHKLRNVHAELETLMNTYHTSIPQSPELDTLMHNLHEVNEKLWDIEDAIREKERKQAFDQEFIEIARSVYFTNDKRCAIKRAINELLGSRLIEEKSYTDYTTQTAAA